MKRERIDRRIQRRERKRLAERSRQRGRRQAAHLAGAHEGHADRLCLLCPMQERER